MVSNTFWTEQKVSYFVLWGCLTPFWRPLENFEITPVSQQLGPGLNNEKLKAFLHSDFPLPLKELKKDISAKADKSDLYFLVFFCCLIY